MKGRNQYILYLINIIVFILLETVALRLISHNSVLQRTEIIKSVSAVTNAFSGVAGNIGRYFNLGSLNRKLAEENVALRRENDRLRAALADVSVPDSVRTESPLFDYIPALVVSNSTDRLHNVLIINKGRRDGVREDMGVVTDRGLVGYIQSVSENTRRYPPCSTSTTWRAPHSQGQTPSAYSSGTDVPSTRASCMTFLYTRNCSKATQWSRADIRSSIPRHSHRNGQREGPPRRNQLRPDHRPVRGVLAAPPRICRSPQGHRRT